MPSWKPYCDRKAVLSEVLLEFSQSLFFQKYSLRRGFEMLRSGLPPPRLESS